MTDRSDATSQQPDSNFRPDSCPDCRTLEWLDPVGGELLQGSGFENEMPDSDFAGRS